MNLEKLLIFVLCLILNIGCYSQNKDSTLYYQNLFSLEENICNGKREIAYNYLKKDLKNGLKMKQVFKLLPAEYHIVEYGDKKKKAASLILLTDCDGDEETYFLMALYLELEFRKNRLIRFSVKNVG